MSGSISKPAPCSLLPTRPLDGMQVGAPFGENPLVPVGRVMVSPSFCQAHFSVPRSTRPPLHASPLWSLRPLRTHALHPCRGGLTRRATIPFYPLGHSLREGARTESLTHIRLLLSHRRV